MSGAHTSYRQAKLFYRYFEPEVTPQATLVVVHGMKEHCGRYERFPSMPLPKVWLPSFMTNWVMVVQ